MRMFAAVAATAVAALVAQLLVARRRRQRQRITASQLDTPTLLLDVEALEHNITTLAHFARRHRLLWRPHCKAIRNADMANMMIRAGACGVTCAKVSQAVALVDGGVADVLIANEVVGPHKIAELVHLARRAVVGVAVDDASNLRQLSSAAVAGGVRLAVLVDVDAGMGRCGVPHDDTARIIALCRAAIALPSITFRGLMGYDGHTQSGSAEARLEATCFAQRLGAVKKAVEAAGIDVGVVSGAGSGNFARAAQLGVVSELQAGGGVLFCGAYQKYHANWGQAADERAECAQLRPALHLLAQVVSVATPGRIVADAGFKASVPVPFPPTRDAMPQCVSHSGLRVTTINAEHMVLAAAPDAAPTLSLGSRLILVPCYSDSTTLLHRVAYGVRQGGGPSASFGCDRGLLDPDTMVVECEFDLRPSMGALF